MTIAITTEWKFDIIFLDEPFVYCSSRMEQYIYFYILKFIRYRFCYCVALKIIHYQSKHFKISFGFSASSYNIVLQRLLIIIIENVSNYYFEITIR